jgi:Uma2 family endonuclease
MKTAGKSAMPEPAWDVAQLFPAQGQWYEEDYLALDGNRIVEFSDGNIEVLPIPTTSHQLLVIHLYGLLNEFTTRHVLGTVLVAALRIRLRPGKFREPDVVFMLKEHASRIHEKWWDGADLVMEVISDDEESRRRDLVVKRGEYARAGIAEYWIVDPQEERITVLKLAGKKYAVHGEFSKGTVANSHLLKGFSVDVADVLSRQLPKSKKPRKAAK